MHRYVCSRQKLLFLGKPGDSIGILEEFFLYYPRLDTKLFWQEYKNRLFILEEKVTVTQGNSQFDAYVLDLTKDFHLKVLKTNGDITLLSNGEISLII